MPVRPRTLIRAPPRGAPIRGRILDLMADLNHPLDDPSADPFAIAAEAASDIRRLTGVDRHDIAVTLG